MMQRILSAVFLLMEPGALALAEDSHDVLVVANQKSSLSQRIAEYYVRKRSVPLANYCRISAPDVEEIDRATFSQQVDTGIRRCLTSSGLTEKITYIIITQGVPLKIKSNTSDQKTFDGASVDSELCLLYRRMRGINSPLAGPMPNPFYNTSDASFARQKYGMYVVARLASQTVEQVAKMIDDSVAAERNPAPSRAGKVVIDLKKWDSTEGNDWLERTAIAFPKEQVVFDDSERVLDNVRGVIAYASWGSNDPDRKQRHTGFRWLPGSIATAFVSTDARTFAKPPDSWTIGPWTDKSKYFAGAPQSLASDLLAEGATAATGHVYEPFLIATPRPHLLFPAYLLKGRTLGEAYYLSIPYLSWQNILIGDPLMRLPP